MSVPATARVKDTRSRIHEVVVEIPGNRLITGRFPMGDSRGEGLDLAFFKRQNVLAEFQKQARQTPKPDVLAPLSWLLSLDTQGRRILEDATPAPVGTVFALSLGGAKAMTDAMDVISAKSPVDAYTRKFMAPMNPKLDGRPLDRESTQPILFIGDLYKFNGKGEIAENDGCPVPQFFVSWGSAEDKLITFQPVDSALSSGAVSVVALKESGNRFVFKMPGFGDVSVPQEQFVGFPVVDSFSQWGGEAVLAFSTRRLVSGELIASETFASALVRAGRKDVEP